MASETSYFVVEYDTEASGPYVAGTADELTWTGGGRAHIITVIDEGTSGKLACGLIAGSLPTSAQVLTQTGTTSNTVGPSAASGAEAMLYPASAREDLALATSGAITWAGPALGATHSFFFDGQTGNVSAGDILTFSPGGQQCEVITVVSDAGVSGELDTRWITNLDTLEFPDDNDTFSNGASGDGALNGVVHPRCYSPLTIHRLLGDLADDEIIQTSGDVLSIIDPTPSERSTDQIISLLGTVAINDTVAQHMFGGSITQTSGDVVYSGLDLQITDPDGSSEPVVIQDDAIVTEYWANAYMPNSIAGRVRIMIKTREDDVDIDGKRVTGRLLEFGDSYFVGSTTLSTGTTGLALFSVADGNNETAVGTVAGAPYNTIVVTEGYQTIDYNNGNGAQPYIGEVDFGSASSAQTWERLKYIQRRGTAETLSGRNAQLYIGGTLNLAYDAESGTFVEDEAVAWGTEIPYTAEAGGTFAIGNVLQGDTSTAVGRIIYVDDNGTTGTLIVAQDSGATAFNNTEGLTEVSGGSATGVTATSGTVVTNTAAGTGILLGLDDDGTTGNLYLQRTRGVSPADNQTVYGTTNAATAATDAATTLETRVIAGQCFFGTYTGSAFNPGNYGWGIDTTDAIATDLFTDLLGATQQPPNNQTGLVEGVAIGDRIAVYPWNGAATDVNGDPLPTFGEMLTVGALTGGESTITVNAIPANTPASGNLRLERDSDGQYDLIPYTSFTGAVFTLTGTVPNAAANGNNIFRAFIDQVATATSESYQAVQTTTNQVTIILRRGGVNPIKTFKGSATFGAAGFTASAQRITDA